MRCLVTGASGHVGAALTRLLVARGEDVTVLVRPASDLGRLARAAAGVRVIRGDLSDVAAAAREIEQASPEVVFHLAWSGVAAASRDDPSQVTRNVAGTLAVFDAARAGGMRRWVGVGSQAEYGPQDVPLREDLPAKPANAYGLAKLCAGLLTGKMCELAGLESVWVRLVATYGPGHDEGWLIPSVICRLLRGERPALTAGTQRCDYLFVEDAAEALYAVGRMPGVSGVFNLGSGDAHSVRHIVERIRDLIDPTLPVGFGEAPCRAGTPPLLVADVAKLTAATGWRPTTSLAKGLSRTIEWYRARQSPPAGAGRAVVTDV